MKHRPVLLCILDGFGYREAAPDNAIAQAHMPTWQKMWATCPHALLATSGRDVGLPDGQMGNSEVGHMNLGAGRVVYQDLPLIDRAIETGELAAKKELADFISALQKTGGCCHLMGLASPGGVHSHQKHIVALAALLSKAGIRVCLHAFLDGRDVPPQSAVEAISQLITDIEPLKGTSLSTVCGRYYAMDRDKRWDRVEKAYRLLVDGEGSRTDDLVAAIQDSYVDGVYDEFVLPIVKNDYVGMKNGDAVLFANFRADRAREILTALADPSFDGFVRPRQIAFAGVMGMVEYSDHLNKLMTTLFPPKILANTLGELASCAGLKQLRIAETEKYPHVTFFFNGGREAPYEGEERILIPSPKVATYDLQPEMSAASVTDKVVEAVESGRFDLIILNYANPDMVGHTGSMPAAVKALETLDVCLARLLAALQNVGGVGLLTADHGNCEQMFDPGTKGPHTAHTLSKVPVVLINGEGRTRLRDGRLADVAPTLLDLLGLAQPSDMDGESLLVV